VNPILKRVREVIEDSGLSQNALERAELGTQAMFSKWMRLDDAEPGSTALARLVTYFGVNGHWLLTGEGQKRTAAAGADAVYQQGYVAGLARAEQVLRKLRAAATAPAGAPGLTPGEAQHLADLRTDLRASQRPQRNRKRSNGG
jgi:hypothetical protein